MRKQPKCPLTEEWINKIWYSYTMEYYSPIKKKEVLLHAPKWMNLKNIMLSESQTLKAIMYDSIYMKCSYTGKYHRQIHRDKN